MGVSEVCNGVSKGCLVARSCDECLIPKVSAIIPKLQRKWLNVFIIVRGASRGNTLIHYFYLKFRSSNTRNKIH